MLKKVLSVRKWLVVFLSSGCLFQATTGCPTGDDLKKSLAGSAQTAVTNVLGLYTKAVMNSAFGV